MGEAEDWSRLKELFDAAMELPPDSRASMVAARCGDRPDLRVRLEAMLKAADSAPGFLEGPAVAVTPDEWLSPGDTVADRYVVLDRLGAGGMGVVYRVRHSSLNREFALKVIQSAVDSDDAARGRFEAEAQTLGRLRHPNIVDVTDYGIDNVSGRPYLVMEYLEGQPLSSALPDLAERPVEAFRVLGDTAAALDHAHRHGILHRDLKPENVFLAGDGTVKLMDFGLAVVSSAVVANAPLMGTPEYMAPELLQRQPPTVKSDVYSFAVLTRDVIAASLHLETSAEIPSPISRALSRALSSDPTARPEAAGTVLAEVRLAWDRIELTRWRRSHVPKRLALAGAGAFVLALGVPLMGRLPATQVLERRLVDMRFSVAPARSPDPRLLLLMIDEATLAADPTPLVDRADEFGSVVNAVFAAGATAVAVDLLLPESWGRSPDFVKAAVSHADKLTLAAYSAADGGVIGPEVSRGWITAALGVPGANDLFAFTNVEEEPDGRTRRSRRYYIDRTGRIRAAWSARAVARAASGSAAGHDDFWIDHRIAFTEIPRISWKDAPDVMRADPAVFRDRIVLIGGNYAASGDELRLPNLEHPVPGVIVHALAANTMLDEYPIRMIDGGRMAAVAAGFTFVVVLTALSLRSVVTAVTGHCLIAAIFVGSSVAVFLANQIMVPVAPVLGLLVVGSLSSFVLRSRLTRFPAPLVRS